MADTFEEMATEYHENDNNEGVRAGDDCPKDCNRELHELHHDRDSQINCDPHPSYSRVEVVCTHHGIVESFR